MTDALETTDPIELVFAPAAADQPHVVYARIRNQCPVARIDGDAPQAVISDYENVMWALRHPEFFTSEGDSLADLGEQPLIPLQVDPPRHTKYRRLLNPQFVPREIEKLEPAIRTLVNDLLDAFVERGHCDFHDDFATPLPSGIFLALMGLPMDDLPTFLQWRDDTIRPDVEPGDWEGAERIRAKTAHDISEYFRVAIAERRKSADDTLLSKIVHGSIDGEPLSEPELLGISHLLLLGGLDTVTATLDCMVAYLATHPDRRQQLIDDPSLLNCAIEEMLRHQTPVMMVVRSVKQDVELGGVQLRAGDGVTLLLGAANDDEREFGETAMDFARDPNKHLAFGASHHLCLGAHLARLELRVALEELHRRIPSYRIREGAEIHFSPGIRQADNLPLEWDVPATA